MNETEILETKRLSDSGSFFNDKLLFLPFVRHVLALSFFFVCSVNVMKQLDDIKYRKYLLMKLILYFHIN